MRTIAIIGAGGNAREVAGIIRDRGTYEFVGFLTERTGKYDSVPIGSFEWLEANHVDCLAMGIGNPQAKFSIGHMLRVQYPEVEWPAIVHPTAYIGPTCELQPGAIVGVGAIATENVIVGSFAQLNFGCTVGHEAIIGSASLVNPGASISGGVRIGERVLVGTGARIIQYLAVGNDAIIGAGAVVDKDVPSGVTVVGVPARPMIKTAAPSEDPEAKLELPHSH